MFVPTDFGWINLAHVAAIYKTDTGYRFYLIGDNEPTIVDTSGWDEGRKADLRTAIDYEFAGFLSRTAIQKP